MGPEEIIKILGLKPLNPEGGYYRESYRSPIKLYVQDVEPAAQRVIATAIYYLLTPNSFSAIHRLSSDEIYHFYMGDPVEMLLLYPDGSGRNVVLGPKINEGQMVQHLVPAGVWQGAALGTGGGYALLGTTVSPGYDPGDFTLGDRGLVAQYQQFSEQIANLIKR